MASASNAGFTDIYYDVFLSFRGEDTRKFTDHLYWALKREGFQTFRDDDFVEKGTFIKSELQNAIMNSRMSVVVLSKYYANSTLCLFELQLILERMKTSDHSVLPVFYEVDPQEIKQQAKSLNFGEKNVTEEVEVVKGWSVALKDVAWMTGMASQYQRDGNEAKLIEEIVYDVKRKLRGKRPRVVDHQELGESMRNPKRVKFLTSRMLMPPTEDFVGSTEARNWERIWECLMNDEDMRIGVHGMGGVGKTTIMKHIYNQVLKETDKFDDVFWVTICKPFTVLKLQSHIAKELKIRLLDKEDEERRARHLFAELSKRKRYVLIIDDLWEAFPLERVGIPSPTIENGCKLVLTTRSLEVCARMRCITVQVELLTEEEALKLFFSKAVEDVTVLAPEVKDIATQIATECARLPLAIVTKAGSLRGLKRTHEWRNALNKLIRSTKDASDGESEVFKRLKFSYSRLRDKVLQDCFLYCSLYPEDRNISVEELIEYWIAEELIADMNSVEAQFDEGHVILAELTNSSLLESFIDKEGNHFIRIHNLIRDMALKITASSPRFMVKAGERLKSVPYEHWSEDLERISFMGSSINELPITPPVCPQLTTLFLNENSFQEIPDSFFTYMHSLEVLDLSDNFRINWLPQSISNLVNLHALILDNCEGLSYVPSLKKLKALKVFTLTWSFVEKLPEGIEELVNLIKLDLSNNSKLGMFPTCKLRRLSKLRFLRMDGTKVNVSAEDLLCLRNLKVAGVKFHNVQELTRYTTSQHCQGLEKYWLVIGPTQYCKFKINGKGVSISDSSDFLSEEISLEELEETPSNPQELFDLNSVPMEVPSTSSHHFSILHVLDLSYTDIKSLPQSISRLVALKKLFLRNCELLMELPPEIGELMNLEVLDLEGTEIMCLPKEIANLVKLTCLKVSFHGYASQTLQTVIPRGVLSNLSRLNELIIDVTPYGEWWDDEAKAIIDDLRGLKQLVTLKLYLPTTILLEELRCMFPGLSNFRFTVGRHEEHFISRLRHNVEEEFNNLQKGLKYINGSHTPNEITKVFKPNAFFLQRHWTAKSLSDFGHENINEVKFCLVMECNEFRTIIDSEQFYQGKDAIVLGALERLIIHYLKNVESIWKGPVGKGSLSNLKSLVVHRCPNLTTLLTIDMLNNLSNLEELIVKDCPKINSLLSLKSSESKSDLFLPSLKKISLLELPDLVSISSGLRIAPKLERMVIFYCSKLEKLSTAEVSSTELKVIKGEKEWWDALKWYESDLTTEHEDYLARLFIPLRRAGDLFAQLTED